MTSARAVMFTSIKGLDERSGLNLCLVRRNLAQGEPAGRKLGKCWLGTGIAPAPSRLPVRQPFLGDFCLCPI